MRLKAQESSFQAHQESCHVERCSVSYSLETSADAISLQMTRLLMRLKAAFEPAGKVGAACLGHCQSNGLIARAIGDVMGFCPPLVITSEQIDELFDKFELAMAATLEWANGEGLLAA